MSPFPCLQGNRTTVSVMFLEFQRPKFKRLVIREERDTETRRGSQEATMQASGRVPGPTPRDMTVALSFLCN